MVQYEPPPVLNPDTIPGPLDTAQLDALPPDTSGALEAESLFNSESAQVSPFAPSPDTVLGPPDTSSLDTTQLQETDSLLMQESLPTAPPPGMQ